MPLKATATQFTNYAWACYLENTSHPGLYHEILLSMWIAVKEHTWSSLNGERADLRCVDQP